MRFIEVEHGYQFDFDLFCNQPTGFPWQLTIFPGTYRVLAGGYPDTTNLPGRDQVIHQALVVDGPLSNLALDVQSVTVSGTLLSNGVPAKPNTDCYDGNGAYPRGRVRFIEVDHGYQFDFDLFCSHATGFPWQLTVFPGTYRVLAGGYPDTTNLPGRDQVIHQALVVDGPLSNLTLDVESVTVSGTLLSNGVPAKPNVDCYDGNGAYPRGRVRFIEVEHGYQFDFDLFCSHATGFPWQLTVFPGTYRVLAGGYPDTTNLPGRDQVIHQALVVDGPLSNLALDVESVTVSGTLLSNGVPAKPNVDCYDGNGAYPRGRVRFIEVEHGYQFDFDLFCSHATGFPWQLTVFPGTYRVLAGGYPDTTNLPGRDQVIYEALQVP